MKIKILELFGGIGACTQALKRIGVDVEVADYVEIDKYAVASYNAINGTNFEPQDICEWDKNIEVDLIMHGSPCQDFSVAGKQAGGDVGSGTRSSLMYETIRIVSKLKPKYVVWENVKNLLSEKHRHNFESYLEIMRKLGYTNYYQVLNAKDYGIPQNRERIFTVSVRKDVEHYFEFPQKQELKIRLKDILDDVIDEKYYLSQRLVEFFYQNEQNQKEHGNGFRFGVSDGNVIASAVTTRAGGRMDDNFISCVQNGLYCIPVDIRRENQQSGVILKSRDKRLISMITKTRFEEGKLLNLDLYNQSINEDISQCLTEPKHSTQRIFDGYRIRKLTPKECWRLMGFSDKSFDEARKVNSDTQLFKQAGNSIVVNVLEEIFKILILDEFRGLRRKKLF